MTARSERNRLVAKWDDGGVTVDFVPESRDLVARVAAAVKAAAGSASGDRPAEREREIGVRYEFTVPGVRIVVEAV